MADVDRVVPGTWFLAVTEPSGQVERTIMTFTSDGGMVERAEPTLAAAVGVWEEAEKEEGKKESEFRFMLYRFLYDLTVTEPTQEEERLEKGEMEEKEVVAQTFSSVMRVRSTNRMIDDDTFQGTATVDFLDAAAVNPIPGSGVFKTTHRGIRLKLVPEP
jgi:hypothetical protein